MADNGNPIGKVSSVGGEAFAKGEDGSLRQVRVGDPVFEGEIVQAAPGGHVELAFRDGTAYFLRDREGVTLDGMTFGGRGADGVNVVGKVASVEGQVFAKGADGSVRQLRVGDPVFEGEVIQTPTTNGRVELSFNSGATYFLRDKEAVTLDGMVLGGRVADARESALQPGRAGELEDISRAIAEGRSLDRLLEETSAGRPLVFGRTDDGHSFVQLLRIAEAIDPLGFQFGNRDQGKTDDVVGGGGQGENQTSPAPAVITSASTPAIATTVSLTASPSIAEGGSITYTASLGAAAQGQVLVTITGGSIITIASGASSGTVSVAAPGEDVYLDSSTVSRSITGATGGNFESLAASTVAATTSISDTTDATTVSLTASPSIAEGGSITYTASLGAAAQGQVLVTITGGSIITIASGASSGTVSVAAPGEDVYLDSSTVSRSITGATGGNFESLAASTVAATTSISDTTDATTVSLTASPSIAEGGSITYTASLGAAAQGQVLVTITGGSIITIASGASSGTVSVAAPGEDVYLDSSTVSRSITGATGGNFESLAASTVAATTSISDTTDATTVSLTASPSIAEGGSITYTASLGAAAQGQVLVTITGGSIITIASGASSGTVSVAAPGEDVYLDSSTVSRSITGATGGNFESLAASTVAATTSISDTTDATTVSLTASPSIAEGGSITYTASLGAAAQGQVLVTITGGSIITIASGASSGTVSVAAPGEDVYLDSSTVSRSITGATGGNFESLAASTVAATTSISDTTDATTVSLTASPSIAEGGSITYTASLGAAAQGQVLVTITGGSIITIASGASSGTVSVAAPGEDVYLDSSTVSRSITGATGGNFESLAASTVAATTSISDTTDATTVSLTASPSIAEGGSITYTASLGAAAQGQVLVTITGGSIITIASGASSGTVSVAAPGEDVYLDSSTVSRSITGATGGNFESLAASTVAATTSISDTTDATTVSLTASPSIAEGGSITYTASLGAAAQGQVLVTITGGSIITIASGASSGTVSVAAPGEDVYLDSSTVSRSITGATGGNFESLAASTVAATTSISDTTDATTVSLTASPSIAEGGSITYTASLGAAAQGQVLVTITGGSIITIASGASSGTVSVAAPGEDVYLDSSTVSRSITGATGGNFESLAASTVAATTSISDTTDATTVSLTASPSIAEGGSITYTASLGAAAQGQVLVTITGGSIITIASGASSGTVSVAAPGEDVYLDSSTVSRSITGATGGNFESLAASTVAATTSISDTTDATTVSLTASPSIAEGGSITYTASLGAAAQGQVLVTITGGSIITIASGASSGTVSVAAPGEDVYLDSSTVSRSITGATGGNFESLAASTVAATTSISDTTDATTVSLTASPSIAEGGSITYTASLGAAAQGQVLVTITGGSIITIASGASSGTVSVAAPGEDVYLDSSTVSRSITGATGGNFESLAASTVAATTSISDTTDATTVSLTASPSIAEGGSITYTASLGAAAQGQVLVTITGGSIITIASGASSGTVSVAAPGEDVYLDSSTVSRSITGATGGNFESLAASTVAATTSISDTTDATTVSLTASPSIAEGGSITYTASLGAAAQGQVLVTITGGSIITIASGASSGTVSVAAPGEDVYLDSSTVSRSITGATGGNFESLAASTVAATTSISDTTDATTVSLTASPSIAEGGSITYTASLGAAAQGQVLVTITGGSIITIASGASSGTVSVAAPGEDVYLDSSTVSRSITGATGGNFESLAASTVAATTSISDTTDATTVSLTASPSIAEGGSITYTASLGAAAQGQVLVTITGGSIITIASGASSGTVSVAAPGEDVYLDSSTVSRSITGATGGNFESLAASTVAATTSISDTTDATTVSLTASPSIAEGGSITYTASLGAAAQGQVLVTITGGSIITIASGASSGTVSVAAPGEDVYLDSSTVSRSITGATGGNFESLAASTVAATTSISDTTDATTVSLTASPSIAEGGSITYTASLGAAAQGQVLVTITGGSIITIASGASSGTVSVAAPGEDVYLDSSTVSRSITGATGGNFESLAASTVAATTSISDTTDATTVSLTASPSIAEGGSITYTASLGAAAQGQVLVTITGGSIITIASGASSGTVSVAAPGEDVYLDSSTVSRSITGATGGNFESLAASTVAATTSISDTTDATTVSLTASPSIAEGGSITYTASLGAAAQGQVLVTITGGSIITIASGASSGTVSVAAPGEDVYLDSSTVSRSITGATGGNFESLAASTVAATTSISDTTDATTVSLTASPSIAEGGSITYTASLGAAAQGQVLVTITGGSIITIASGASSGTVSVAAPGEDVYLDSSTVSRSITGATGGNFESLAASTVAATTSISDTTDATTVSLSGAASVTEGSSASYTVSLSSAAQSDVTVSLTYSGTAANGTDITGTTTVTIASGASSGNFSVSANNDAFYEGTENFTITLAGASGGNFENLQLAALGSGGNITTTVADNESAPVNSVPGAQSSTEDTTKVFSSANGNAITVSDVDGGTLTTTISIGNGTLTASVFAGATITNNGTGTVTISGTAAAINGALNGLIYTPTADYNGAATLNVLTSDGTQSDSDNITVNVSAVADAADDIVSMAEDATVNINVNANDSFENAGHAITHINGSAIAVNGSVAVANGSVTLKPDGTLDFVPTSNFNGATSFTYTVTSGGATETATVNLTLTPVNDAPINSLPGPQAATEDTNKVFSAANGNAITVTDVDSAGTLTTTVSIGNGTLTAVAFAGATITNNGTGTVTISGTAAAITGALNGLTYTPTADYNGAATLTVTSTDGSLTDVDTVAVTVSAVADIANDSVSTNEGVAVVISALGNDTFENGGRTITEVNGLAITAGGPAVTVANGTVTLNGAGTQFTFTPATDYAGATSFTYTVSSGGVTETATVNVTVNNINDAPVLDLDASASGTGFATAFNLDTGNAITIGDVDLSITDVDDTNIESATISIAATNRQGSDVLAQGSLPGGITATWNAGTFTLTLTGSASLADYQTAIRTVTFDTGATTTGQRTINVKVNDGTVDSNTASTSITILGSGARPVIDLDADNSSGATVANYQTTFSENGAAVSVSDADILITDSNSANLNNAVITLTNAQSGDTLSWGSMPIGITASIAGNVVTLTGSASKASYQTAIAAVTFSNNSENPNTTPRVVTVIVYDGIIDVSRASNTATTTINVVPVADPPVLDLDASAGGTGYTTTYNEGATAVAIADTDISITDVDSSSLTGATITLTNAQANDVLSWGTLPGGITASLVGNVVTLSGAASLADYQTAIRAVSFSNTSTSPNTTPRTITVTVTDGVATSAAATTTVTVTDSPGPVLDLDANNSTASGSGYLGTFNENGSAVSIADSDLTLTDSDSNLTSVTVTLTNPKTGDVLAVGSLPPGITATVSGNVIVLSGSDTPANYKLAIAAITFNNTVDSPDTTPRTIVVSATDGTNAPAVATATINVVQANEAPVLDLDANNNTVSGTGYNTFFSTVTGTPVAIGDTDVSVTDVDSTNIVSATITLTNMKAGDVFSVGTLPPGVTATIAANVVTLSGAAFYTDYQAAIRAVTFDTTSSDLTARSITVKVNDGTQRQQCGDDHHQHGGSQYAASCRKCLGQRRGGHGDSRDAERDRRRRIGIKFHAIDPAEQRGTVPGCGVDHAGADRHRHHGDRGRALYGDAVLQALGQLERDDELHLHGGGQPGRRGCIAGHGNGNRHRGRRRHTRCRQRKLQRGCQHADHHQQGDAAGQRQPAGQRGVRFLYGADHRNPGGQWQRYLDLYANRRCRNADFHLHHSG
jgi:hypothetical protein